MCGRYASLQDRQDLIDAFEVEVDESAGELVVDYNVAPTKTVPLIYDRDGRRELRAARWGLVPSWADDVAIGSRFINARAETIARKPAFRAAYEKRRCLLPADGYYEWTGRQPHFIHCADGGPMAMAGVFEWWRRDLLTCTIITTRANDDVSRIHDRMPVLVPKEHWGRWLDKATAVGSDLLEPAPLGLLAHYAVAPVVNNVRNNGPELVSPVSERGIYGEQPPLRLF